MTEALNARFSGANCPDRLERRADLLSAFPLREFRVLLVFAAPRNC